jgi:hypothetical protein
MLSGSVTIITPVGPGHDELVKRCVNSVGNASNGVFSNVKHVLVDDSSGELGRSKARNNGVKDCSTEWVFFLDADDLLTEDAFDVDLSDYDAIWGTIMIHDRTRRMKVVPRRPQHMEFYTYSEIFNAPPHETLQIGHLVKRGIALSEPFNEDMNCGEDFDYYLRVWEKYKCAKIRHAFMVNCTGSSSTGPKSATPDEWRKAVKQCLEAKKPG